jgi:hypothetical protein
MAMEHPNFVQQPPGALLGDLDKESQKHWDCVKAWYETYKTYWVETDEYNKNLKSIKCDVRAGPEYYSSSGDEEEEEEELLVAKTSSEPERQPRNLEEAVEAMRGLKRKTAWSEEEMKALEDQNALSAREGKAAWMTYRP